MAHLARLDGLCVGTPLERHISLSNSGHYRIQGDYAARLWGGVPQSSVLGPILWNVLDDGVLTLNMIEDVMLVVYADDMAVVTWTRDGWLMCERTIKHSL